MNNNFAIIPVNRWKVEKTSRIIASIMQVDKVKISRENYIIIGKQENIIFDINSKMIKGKILGTDIKKEKEVVKKIIKRIDDGKIYFHFYGEKSSLDFDGIREV